MTHTIKEAKMFTDLQSTKLRLQRTDGVVPIWVQRPKNQQSKSTPKNQL